MALLKAFVCQVILLGLYKVFLEKVVEEHLVPDELTRNCLVGFVCLLCFGIQLYTEKVEEQAHHEEVSRTKSRRRSPPDTAESVSEFLDARTAHMMRTLDVAMQQMSQMPVSDGYVQSVIFAAAGPEQTFSKQTDQVVVEEIYTTKLDDVIYANENDVEKSKVPESTPIVVPLKVEEVEEKEQTDSEEEEVEEETETKSDVCEEEEDDVVTVIDVSKPKQKAAESEEEEEEEEEEVESIVTVNQRSVKTEVKPDLKPSKVEDDDVDEEEEEEEESEEEENEVKKGTEKVKAS